ncbi:MBL fold metallo-hydrolase [Nakamurella sp. PAMC28650]|uniref:MBL fold metallo-hydrolase n=1 Tax=Nakamurella sp. PAMC28650 TaxID=2762325 RepID=UPI00164EC71E|nr:MBL fold metallo-hydrolase [Nakamurella sp. PAMC28650]QNK82002.1 MBL fold metallo-hydrolase [Nakamurella sp. PAMC28650]
MPEISWWGHATATIADSGVRILTDPVLTPTVGHLRRRRGPAPTAAASEADLVLISHLHGDHLHVRSLRQISHRVPIVLPRGAQDAIRALRFLRHRQFIEISAGEVLQVGSVRIRAVPARHDSRRHLLARLGSAPPLGFVIEGERRTYFAGDTALYPEMAHEVGACDVALLPVGGWGPGLGPGHLNSSTAAEAVARLGVTHVVPIHFGTLWPIGMDRMRPEEFLPPGQDFVRSVARIAPEVSVHLLTPGQTVRIPA